MATPHHGDKAGISPETLALLRRLRITHRHRPTIYRDLLKLTAVAIVWDLSSGNARDTEHDSEHPLAAPLVLTVQQAAKQTGLKPVTIRRACREQRLTATKHGRDWHIDAIALAEWMARRAA